MARPKLLKPGTSLTPGSVTANGWVSSGGTVLSVVQGAGGNNYVSGTTGTAFNLTMNMSAFSPGSTQYLYGIMLEVLGLGCTVGYTLPSQILSIPYIPIKCRITCGAGVKVFELQARDLTGVVYGTSAPVSHGVVPVAANTGDDKFYFLYAFDNKVTKWDLSGPVVEIWAPYPAPIKSSGVYVVLKKVQIWPLYMVNPPNLNPPAVLLSEPPHVWSPDGRPATLSGPGGTGKPAVWFPIYEPSYEIDVPDVVRVIHNDDSQPPSGTTETDFGIVTPRPDDRGLVVGRVDLSNPTIGSRAQQYIHCKSGWLVPATGEYYWTDWTTLSARPIANTPVPPGISAVINGDQVDVTVFAANSLLAPFYYGHAGTSAPDIANLEHPTVQASVNTLSFLAAYDTNAQRSDWAFRVTRNTIAGSCDFISHYMPVQTGKTYYASVYFRTSISVATTVFVNWYNSSGTFLSQSNLGNANSTTRTNQQYTVVAPANAAWATLQVQTASVAVGTTMDLDQIVFARYDGVSMKLANAGGYIWGNAAFRVGSAKPLTGNTVYWHEDESPADATITEVTTLPRTGTHHISFVHADPATLVVPLFRHYLPEAIPAGTVMSTRCWVRSTPLAGNCTIGLRFIDSVGDIIIEEWGARGLTNTSAYTVFKAENVVVPDNTAAIFFVAAFSPTSDTQYIDDIGVFFTATCPGDNIPTPGHVTGAPYPGFLGYLVIERQLANSTTWTPIAISQVNPNVDWVYSDYTVPEGMSFKYRARVLGTMDGYLVEGQYSAEETETTTSPGLQWTLWDPSSDAKGPLRFDIEGSSGEFEQTLLASLAMYTPVGRNRRVLTKDVSKGRVFNFTVDLIDSTQLTLWETYHTDRNVLILTRTSTGECWSVVITSDLKIHVHNTTPARYTIDIQLEEVDVPAVW